MEHIQSSTVPTNWHELSFFEQMGNIGSEVGRARKWQNKSQKHFEGAFSRAHELLMYTIADKRWVNQLDELCRVKEVLCDAYCGGVFYKSDFVSLEKYFYHFALAARRQNELNIQDSK